MSTEQLNELTTPGPQEEHVQYAGMLVWQDGQPRAVVSRNFDGPKTEASLRTLMQEVLNLPYTGQNPNLKGLTKGEAMIITLADKASVGDMAAVKEMLDRILGRSTQSIQSVSVTGTLEEYLDAIAEKTAPTMPKDVIDITREGKIEDLF